MEYDLIEDISQLSTISKNSLSKLSDIATWAIANCVEDSTLNSQCISDIDIGIGSLIIKVEKDNIKYKFVPSNKLDKSVRDTILDRKNPLVLNIEKSLISKISNIYKELL